MEEIDDELAGAVAVLGDGVFEGDDGKDTLDEGVYLSSEDGEFFDGIFAESVLVETTDDGVVATFADDVFDSECLGDV